MHEIVLRLRRVGTVSPSQESAEAGVSTGHRNSYPGELTERLTELQTQSKALRRCPAPLPCAALRGGPAGRRSQGTAPRSGERRGTSSEEPRGRGWRGAGCLPLPLPDTRKSPACFALAGPGKKDAQGGGYSDNVP